MSNITFRGATVGSVDIRDRDEAGVFVRVHVKSELTNPVLEAMGWEYPGEGQTDGGLKGLLTSRSFVLTPNQKELRQYEIQMECSEVRDFTWARLKNKDGDSTRIELRFSMIVNEPGAEANFGHYKRTVGRGEGALKITYTDQQKLPLGEKDGQKNCVDCANGVGFMEGSDTIHASGQPCAKKQDAKSKEAPLASAREAAVGTHQRRRRGEESQVQ